MMRQLDICSEKWYTIYAETNRLNGLFLLPNFFNTIIVNLAAASKGPDLFVSATTEKAKRSLRLFFVQLNSRNEKVQVLRAPELWKDFTIMCVCKTVGMIASFKTAVNIPNYFPTIPNEESPGGPPPRTASDSILSLPLIRRDKPGRSALFPLLAASIVDSLLSGAASPYVQLKLFYLIKGAKALCTKLKRLFQQHQMRTKTRNLAYLIIMVCTSSRQHLLKMN